MVDSFAEMHHLVSAGYQRNFSYNHRVAVVEARTGQVVDPARPVKSNFARPGYNTYVKRTGEADSRLEREFAALERPISDQIRRITPTNCGPKQGGAVVTLFALHLVRSKAFQAGHSRIIDDLRQGWLPDIASRPGVRERLVDEFGEIPTEQGVIEFGERLLAENVSSNRLHVDSMVRMYNSIAEKLSSFQVQVITSAPLGIGFALGDIPVVHANSNTGQYGFRDNLAIGDANLIVGPLTRFTAAALSAHPLVLPVSLTVKKRFQKLNAIFARAALREVACHPGDALEVRRVCQNLDRFPPDSLVRR